MGVTVSPPYFGASFYPENWDQKTIKEDIRKMKDIGMNVMRVGEFAWSRMEPEEGMYDFGWLHDIVNRLGENGIAVIMCTPTCTPPVWLTSKYPEVLFTYAKGSSMQHGGRRHACPNNEIYRDYCRKIVMKMALEFGKDPNVIGWQIDNELYSQGEMERKLLPQQQRRGCACPVCHEKFIGKMKAQFGNIEALNAAWGTNLWSQSYQAFEQLPVPQADTFHHPSLLTAWMLFQSDSVIEFLECQSEILKDQATQPVGTDMMSYGGLDYYKIHKTLDIVQMNHYSLEGNLWKSVFWMNLSRPIIDRPFWNCETDMGITGSNISTDIKSEGCCLVNSWLAYALGGEATLYWHWRSHWSGQEIMHGSVLSSQGRFCPNIAEVKQVAIDLDKAGEFIRNTKVEKSGIALLYSTQAFWTFIFQPMVKEFDYSEKILGAYFKPLASKQLNMDIIYPEADISGYKLILTPFLPSLEEEGFNDRILDWVEKGGTWITGPLSDIRTMHATKYKHSPYGHIEEWLGVYSSYQISDSTHQYSFEFKDGYQARGSLWYDALEVREIDTEIVATYTEGRLKDYTAIAAKKLGKGRIVLLGTLPQPETLSQIVISEAGLAGISPAVDASPNILAVPRIGEACKGLVIAELENSKGRIYLDKPMTDLLTGEKCEGETDILPYTVKVLKY